MIIACIIYAGLYLKNDLGNRNQKSTDIFFVTRYIDSLEFSSFSIIHDDSI